MGMSEKIKIVLVKRKLGVKDLAESMGCSGANISNKLRRDNFSEKELRQIADILNCDLDITFTLRDTSEKI